MGALGLGQHGQHQLGVGRLGQPLHPHDQLDLDAGRVVERLADVPRPVGRLRPRRPVEREVGLHPGRQALAGQAVGRLPGDVAEQHVDLEPLLEGLALEEGALERVAQRADGIGEDVVEHGVGRLQPDARPAGRGPAAPGSVGGHERRSAPTPRRRGRSVAMRRPVLDGVPGLADAAARWAAVASMSATVNARPQNAGRPVARRLGRADDLEDDLAQPEEALQRRARRRPRGCAGPRGRWPRGPRWCGRGRA